MDYLVVDLEATCWEKGTSVPRQEIIEIGAVLLDGDTLRTVREFGRFVRPTANPTLSDFCTRLTTIRQRDVDAAEPFPVVLAEFLAWVGGGDVTLCSWGEYDLRQLRSDCDRHRLAWPREFERHLNLKKAFAAWRGIRPCGMAQALRILGLPLEGTHHRGVDDARNIANIARLMPALR